MVALPILISAVYLDSLIYSQNKNKFEWTITGYNFLKANLIDGHAKFFGCHPPWTYFGMYLPAIFHVTYPFVIWGVYLYTKESWNKGLTPEISYLSIFYILFFSLISHKEKRFMLPIVCFCHLSLGYLIWRKLKVWQGKILCFIYFSLFVETGINSVYYF